MAKGRYLKVSIIDGNYAPSYKIISIVEVKILNNKGINYALNSIVKVSSTYNGTNSLKIIDGIIPNDTFSDSTLTWCTQNMSTAPNGNEWVILDMGSEKSDISEIDITTWFSSGGYGALKDYDVLISSDGNNWNEIKQIRGQECPSNFTTYTQKIAGLFTIKCLLQDKSNNLYTLEDKGKYTENLIPKMTGYNTPSGIVTSSGEYSSAYLAWKAFNGSNDNNGDCWASTSGSPTGWLQYDFGIRNEKIVVKYNIEARNDGNLSETPKSWQFQGSNDDINWITLDTQIDTPKWIAKEVREYFFKNNTKYRFYRLNITANHGNSYVTIGQLKMFEKVFPKLNILDNNLTEELFKNKGFDNPTIIQNKLINQKEIDGIDKGVLGIGRIFEFSLSNDMKTIKSIE